MSLRARLVLAFAYVLVIVLVVLGIPLALTVSGRVETEVEAEASGQAHLIAASVSGQLDDEQALDAIVRDAAADTGGRVIVVDAAGLLVADSAGPALHGDDYGDRPEILTALEQGRAAQGIRRSDTLDEELLVTAVPIVEAGVRTGAVRVTQSVDAVNREIRRDVLVLAGIAAVALLAGIALAWLVAGSLARPLVRLAGTARRFAAGDTSARAELTGSREQRELAVAFNEMTDRISRLLTAQQEFVANASHQLRTPLTGLQLRLEAAALRTDDSALVADLAAAEREVERLARLLTGLLALAREGEDRPRLHTPARVRAVAERAAERWQASAASSGIVLDVRAEPDGWAAAPAEELATMLDNLLENALRYAPADTRVAIEAACGPTTCTIAVVDEGPGLAPGEELAVFERFHRGSAAAGTKGTGIGLPIVRMLARRWGGEATLENRPGGGARAVLTLPAHAGPEALPTPNDLVGEALPGER